MFETLSQLYNAGRYKHCSFIKITTNMILNTTFRRKQTIQKHYPKWKKNLKNLKTIWVYSNQNFSSLIIRYKPNAKPVSQTASLINY